MKMPMAIPRPSAQQIYGITQRGETVEQYVLRAGRFSVSVITYGAILLEWLYYHDGGAILTEEGPADNLVLTLANLQAYESNPAYVGCVVGRYGGRIKQGDLSRAGFNKVQLDQNDRGNCLHGGHVGFNKKIWTVTQATDQSIELVYMSPEGEGGFPGALMATVRYELSDTGALKVTFLGSSESETVYSPTQHTYFNLVGWRKESILNHRLSIEANHYWATDETSAPSECVWASELLHRLKRVEAPETIAALHAVIEEDQHTDKGFDFPFELRTGGKAVLTGPDGKRKLTVKTTCPYVVVYAGGWLDSQTQLVDARSATTPIDSVPASPFLGICFETQEMPNGPFLVGHGPWVVDPTTPYYRETVYEFFGG